jgi:hypothetical protein
VGEWLARYLLARLREPSTWRGLILLCTALGWAIRPELAEAIVALGLALAGGVGVVAPDRVGTGRVRTPAVDLRPADPPADYAPGRTGREDLERWESR